MEELKYLYERSMMIVDFICQKRGGSNPMIDNFKLVVNDVYAKENLKGLKTISRDMNAWAKGLPKKDIQELEILLEARFGENLSGDKITHLVIKKVLKKGKIENKDDYRVVYEYLQDISSKDPFYKNILELETMLSSYQF